MLRQNFAQEPSNEQKRISQSEMRQIIELYDQQIGIATRPSTPSQNLETTTEQPTVGDVAELLGISAMETERLLLMAREQKAAETARLSQRRTVPPPPVSTYSQSNYSQSNYSQSQQTKHSQPPVTVVQNIIVDPHAHLFQKFDENGTRFTPTWNWGAFWFGWLWYFYKGMWAKGLLYFVLYAISVPLSGGLSSLALPIVLGMLGNYDYYLLRCHGTQMWDKKRGYTSISSSYHASQVPNAFAPQKSIVQTPQTNGEGLELMEQKLQLLRDAHERGLINSIEFEEKRLALLNEVENQANLKTLAEAHRLGLLSNEEYERKRQALLYR